MNAASHHPSFHGNRGFGQREKPVVTIRRNGRERSFTIQPLAVAVTGCFLFLLGFGYLGATAYLILRDDLLGATLARQARMQHAYEDRIAALRTQVDLVTSRQLLDQQAVESRVEQLMERQAALGERSDSFSGALKKAKRARVKAGAVKPEEHSLDTTTTGAVGIEQQSSALRLGSDADSDQPGNGHSFAALGYTAEPANSAIDIFDEVENSLKKAEARQIAELKKLEKVARTKVHRLAGILDLHGVKVPQRLASAVGGPLIELKGTDPFAEHMAALDEALDGLDTVRSIALKLPHGSPVPGREVSSRFGSRKDPMTGRLAMHGGMDFRASRGHPVKATAAGTVIKAGRLGGYGKMVEIDHGNGITTRYAHLSRISVQKGQKVAKGEKVGKVGSTGRSTGPHLHYEVRRDGQVRDPAHYVKLGEKLAAFL